MNSRHHLPFAAAALLAAATVVRADHTFRYTPPAGSPDVPVSVVGDFNGWSATATPMARGADGDYTAAVAVPPGTHHYKFVYDNHWIADPKADPRLAVDNGYADVLSGLMMGLGADAAPVPHTFKYVPPAGSTLKAVVVAGDFNGWSTTANPMTKGADGAYTVSLPVAPGKHQYKLVVDDKWTNDPAADPKFDADDGNQGHNSGFDAGQAPAAPSAGQAMHTFHYTPPAATAPKTVVVAGDFNGWSTTANPMTEGADGAYTLTLPVAAGKHQYKFVVDDKWANDPAADPKLDVDDGNQGHNSGFDTAATPTATAAPAGTVPHEFKFTPQPGTTPTAVFVAGDFNGWSTTANPLAKGADGAFTAAVPVTPGRHAYKFVVDGGWMVDFASDPKFDTDDGNQGHNSGFEAAPPPPKP